MLAREAIESLVPHAGAMCLWDEVLDWNETSIRLRARNHRDTAHPLRSDGRLRAIHLCEYGAQAMAVHGGLIAQRDGRIAAPGMLVALRGIELRITRIDDLAGPIDCEARLLAAGEASQQYAFRITHADALLAEGRAAVMLQQETIDGG